MTTKPKPEIPSLSHANQATVNFYAAELRPLLEPTHSGQYVAIHTDTYDYLVERRPGKALRKIQAIRPIGDILVHRIGLADAAYQARMRGEWPR